VNVARTSIHMTKDEHELDHHEHEHNCNRREYIKKAITMTGVTTATTTGIISASLTLASFPTSSHAVSSTTSTSQTKPTNTNTNIDTFQKGKSRTTNYEIQHTPSEWSTILSNSQYNILRKGATERQRSSILEKETRNGNYICAGCNSTLFASTAKFNSGTGWPSFDSVIRNDVVEVEESSTGFGFGLQALDGNGKEVRCKTCGGHLGDVFGDGWRYGSKTGKRYCINGAALIFLPIDVHVDVNGDVNVNGGGKRLRGDIPPPNKVIQYQPSLTRD
jgi:peptide-methionine (R)-S-oxide reductase